MEDEEKFCSNCKRNVAAVNFVIHIAHCERKIQLCQLCGEPVPRSEFDDHLKEYHILENCTCCKLPIEKWKIDSHQKDECYKRLVNCKYCDLSQAFDIISDHEESCGSRTDECSSCNVRFLLKEKEAHLRVCNQDNVLKTLMLCNYCESKFPPEIYFEHVRSCKTYSEKCLACGDLVRLKDLKEHGNFCSKENHGPSSYSCEHCEQKFSGKEFQSHRSCCRARFKICRQCQESVKISDLDHHLEICPKVRRREPKPSCQHCGKNLPYNILENHESSCGLRCEKCPNCHDFVTYRDIERHKEVCGQVKRRESLPLCKHCGKKYPSSILESHESSCGFRYEKCPNCNNIVTYKDMESHKEVCVQEKVPDEYLVSCEYCNENFPMSCLARHMDGCQELVEKCLSCNALVKVGDKYSHKESCMVKRNESELSCEHCEKKFPSNIIENHISNCEFRCEKCAVCYEYVKYKDLEPHKEVCGQVRKYSFVECKHCDCQIPIEMMKEHKSTCNFQKCPLCNVAVQVKDMDNHQSNCGQMKKYPKATCEHCSCKIPINMLEDHEYSCDFHCKICPLCNSAVKVKGMDNHRSICEQKQKCQSKVDCEHCGIQILFKNLDEHELNCGFRLEKCSLCYNFIQVIDTDEHRRECEKKNLPQLPTSCCYCELEFPSDELEYHIISCGANIKKCFRCERIIKLRNFKDHSLECPKNFEKQEDITKNDQVEQALEIESDDRPIPCEYCDETFPLSLLAFHMETCQERTEKCLSCNTSVKFKDKKKHKETCMKPCDRLTKCPFCHVKFRTDFLTAHLDTCNERIENCKNCELPVMQRDKRKHLETCKKVPEEECGICFMLVPKDKLSEHFSECVEGNLNSPYSKCGMSMPLPIASCKGNSEVKMYSEGSKTNLYPSIGNLLLCPYCSQNFPPKRYSNHKKYCKPALIECSICGDTYHIEEKDEHRKTCDALDNVLIPECGPTMELQNKFETLQSEEILREKEALNETCPFCQNKIPEHSFPRHLQTCSQSMKQCRLCKAEYPKESEKDHFIVCPKLSADKDEFLYPGFSSSFSKTKGSSENKLKCKGCRKYVSSGATYSHLTSCTKIRKCPYCYETSIGNMCTHLTKCDGFERIKLRSLLNENTGAKPKKKNAEESSAINRFTGAIKSFFSGPEKTNPSDYMDSQTNVYAGDNYNENFAAPSAPPEENMYISCEFCGKDILMDQEAISVHESGCRPDLIKLPSVVSDEHKLHESASDSCYNQASAFQRESRYLEKPEDKNVTPDDVSCSTDSYSFMRNFRNKYDVPKDISYHEEKATRGNLVSETNDVKHYPNKYGIEDANTWDNKKNSRSKYLEEKYDSKYTTTESNNEYSENVLRPQENDGIKGQADVYETRSYLNRLKISTEPGEFLKNNLDCKQFDLSSSKKNEKFSSVSTFVDNSEVQNSDKLCHSSRKIDAKRTETGYENIYNESDNPIHNNRKNVLSTEDKKSEWNANKTSLNISEDVGVIGTKVPSSKVMNKNAASYADNHHFDSDPESSKEDNSDYGRKRTIHSDKKNTTSYKSDEHTSKSYSSKDYKKDVNAFHATYPSSKVLDENMLSDDSQNDSDPESCKEMKDSNPYDYKSTRSKAEGIVHYTKSGKPPSQDLFKSEDSSVVYSSEMRGPVKIDRISKKKTESKEHFERNKQLTGSHAKDSLYPDVSTFKSTDTFEKSSKDKFYDMYFKGRQPTAKADIDPGMFKNSSYKESSETNPKNQEPMDTDDENNIVQKHTSAATHYFSHQKIYTDVSDSESKDSNMDSYFEFLKNEKDEQPDICRRCGNVMCVCKIEKSLFTTRMIYAADEFDDKGTFQRNAEKLSYMNEQMKTHGETSDYRYLKDKSSLVDDRRTDNQTDDQWKKYRAPFDDSK